MKKIFPILFIFLVVAGGIVYYQLNKPGRNVANEKGISINADSLVATYNANEKEADSKYLNKPVQVTGLVSKVDKNMDGQTTILFNSADPMSSVFCTMKGKGIKIESGKNVTIKGFCSGHTTDVLLTDCVIVNQ